MELFLYREDKEYSAYDGKTLMMRIVDFIEKDGGGAVKVRISSQPAFTGSEE